jgi:uncharacterized membrane protein YeaQ/YmgE (transglycosylase-associated protein family)
MVGMLAFLAQAGDKNTGNDIDVMSILGYIVVGAIVGVLARFLVPGDDPMGIIGTIVLGIVGAVVGGFLAGAVFGETEGVDWIASIIVAVLLVVGYRAISGNRNRLNA